MNIKKTLFNRPQKFTTATPLSPAEKAKQAWDEREGAIIAQNYNLRKLIIGLLMMILILVGAIAYLSTKSSVMPFVVFANPENGEVWHVGTVASSEGFVPDEKVKSYFVRNFVKKVREIPLDPVVYKNSLTEGFNFMTRGAANKLQSELEREKVNEKIGHQTITVNVVSCLPVEGTDSYQVRWTEDEFTIGSGEKITTSYTGIFTTQLIKNDDEKQIMVNPLGFYISDFNWSKENTKTTKVTNAASNNATKAVQQ